MALSLMLLPLLTAFYLPKGLTQLVKTQNTVTVTLGEDAHINCQLMTDFKDILQVTWHKVSPQGTENVATYNKRVGPKVNARFARNVRFEEAGLRNCSIVVGGVSWEDEARYKCLFNAYPEGALTGDTRLRVYELHKPSIHVLENNTRRTASENVTERYPKGHQGSDGGQQKSTVSCSATGQPAPTVLWDAPANVALSNSTLSRVTNGNGTVTVTSTVTVVGRGLHGNVLVRCEASLFSRTVSKDVVMVIGFKDAAVIDDDEDTLVDSIVITTVVCVVLIICGVLLLLWIHKRCHLNKPVDAEKRGTGSPPKTPSRELLTPHSAVRRTPHSQRKGYTSNEIRVPLNNCHSVTSSKGSASLDDGFRDKPHRKLKF